MTHERMTVHEMVARKREADARIAAAAQRVREAREALRREKAKLEAALPEAELPSHPVARFLTLFAHEHGVTYRELIGQARPAYLVKIRHEAIAALAQFRPDYSLTQLGAAFGRRDHTTILHALRKVNGERYRHRPDTPWSLVQQRAEEAA